MPPNPDDPIPEWMPANLMNHFNEHGRDFGYRSFREYEAGSLATIASGRRFTFREPKGRRRPRIGYYERDTGHLTIVDQTHTEIVSYFLTSERYVRDLPESIYP